MRKYVFYDTDVTGYAEYDIRGIDYMELIRTCCRYSKTLSLIVSKPNVRIAQEIKKFEVPRDGNIPFVYWHYGQGFSDDEHFYRVCPELCDLLICSAGGIFEWIDGWGFENPSDPVFYREDGSVFFFSTIHDGVCELSPRSGENVESILCNSLWLLEDEPGRWTNECRKIKRVAYGYPGYKIGDSSPSLEIPLNTEP